MNFTYQDIQNMNPKTRDSAIAQLTQKPKRTRKKKENDVFRSGHERLYFETLKMAGLNPLPTPNAIIEGQEHDFVWDDLKLIVEIEGLTDGKGGSSAHLKKKGFIADCQKYLKAQLQGYTLVRMPTTWVLSGECLGYTEQVIAMIAGKKE